MSPASKLPVYLVTGFLGSGKTTFLQKVIAAADFPRESTALLINDAGPMNIDAKVFKGKAEAVKALSGGCACCVVSKDLQRELRALAKDPRIKQVWIEASGVAEVEDLLDRLTEEDLPQLCEIKRVIHVVDTLNYGRGFFGKSLQHAQWRWADVVLLNKTDLVKPAVLAALREKVLEINPKARVLASIRGEAEESWISGGERSKAKAGPFRVAHAVSVSSCWLEIPGLIGKQLLMEWLQHLPEEIYRVKGFVRLKESPETLQLVHKAGEAGIQIWPYESPVEETGLVLLGSGFNAEALKKSLPGRC
jgi:G3E family GTPase